MRRLLCILPFLTTACATPQLPGAWHPEQYFLQDGTSHDVDGLIFFTASDWSVLFFVTENGEPRRASAEGGTYTLRGNRLVLTHDYNFSYGEEVRGLPSTPPTLRILGTAPGTELCTMELDVDRMTLHFPSGNAMTFRRSSGF